MTHKCDATDIDIINLNRAKAKCYRLLARRAHSRQEMLVKLKQSGFDQNVADQLISQLTDQGLLDDESFAKDLVRWRLDTKLVGKAYLQQELKSKGIDNNIISQVLNDYTHEKQLKQALTLARQKLSPTKKDNWRKVANLLYRRGFNGEIINSVYRCLVKDG